MKTRILLAVIALFDPATVQSQETLTGKPAREFAVYQKKPGFKAFAASPAGAFGYGYDSPSAEMADYLAMKSCDANRMTLRTKSERDADCVIIDRQAK